MHLLIYFNSKPLFLCDAVSDQINEYLHHEDAVFIDELSSPAINSMIREMELEKIHAGVYYHPNLEELKKAFFKKFTRITACGGFVRNREDRALFIFRLGKWDLPKGKLEKGEQPEDACLREIREETGLHELFIEKQLPSTWHTYRQNGKFMLKETLWYAVSSTGNEPLQPQTEEAIEKAEWMDRPSAAACLANTYASVKDVVAHTGWMDAG